MAKHSKPVVDRRNFLKGAAAGAAALAAVPASVAAQPAEPKRLVPPPMSAAAETEAPAVVEVLTADRTGSDYMVDVLKSIGIEYVCANPGSSFRGFMNRSSTTEETKAPSSSPAATKNRRWPWPTAIPRSKASRWRSLRTATVGLQHAAMAIYNAYCDRVPVYLILGNIIDETKRAPGVEWDHSVQDAAAMVRDFTKWDDLPISLEHFAESAVRAYKIAMTPPMLPVVLVADGDIAGNSDFGGSEDSHSQADHRNAARGRYGIGERSGAHAGWRGKSGDYCRPHGAHPRGACMPRRVWPKRCNVRSSIRPAG